MPPLNHRHHFFEPLPPPPHPPDLGRQHPQLAAEFYKYKPPAFARALPFYRDKSDLSAARITVDFCKAGNLTLTKANIYEAPMYFPVPILRILKYCPDGDNMTEKRTPGDF